jgi:predicted alpha-1,6-mannanase (GH76 family)
MNEYQAYATACIERLQHWYDWKTGLWTSAGWWNAANCLEAVIEYSWLTKTDRYHAVISNTFEKHQQGQFLNQYYDDEQWWALTWLKAYDLLQDKRYLSMASQLFGDVCSGWDTVCGGGLWWKKDRMYKNAITNELFLTLAARLCQRTHDEQYFAWAWKEWRWFLQSGLLNEHHLINDGLTQDCRNNAQPIWTYNQGVILGGIVELLTFARDPMWREVETTVDSAIAVRIADAAISTLVDGNGILRDPCEQEGQGCGQDGPQFKGIFVRYLSLLAHRLGQEGLGPARYTRYQQFVLTNADVLWRNNRLPALNAFGLHWSGPVDSTDAARQTAALDAFNAACLLTTLTPGCDHPH